MLSLRKLQTNFSSAIFSSKDEHIANHIIIANLASERRLQIYRNNVFVGLTDALGAIFPVINRLVGEAFFKHVAHLYIKQYPSRSGNLHDFGEHYSRFLSELSVAKDLIYLSDVAQLEWYYHDVFHAPFSEPMDVTRLAHLSPEQYSNIKFELNAASQLLKSEYPVLHIWRVNQDDYTGEDSVDLDEGENEILVIRRNLQVEFQLLGHSEYLFLQAIKSKMDFESVCNETLEHDENFDIEACIKNFVVSKVLTKFYL